MNVVSEGSSRPRPRASILLGAALFALFLSSCSAPILAESWPGISTDGKIVDGRVVDANFVYVVYREMIFRVNVAPSADGRPVERRADWIAMAPNKAHMFAPPAVSSDGLIIVGGYDKAMHAFSPSANPPTQALSSWRAPVVTERFIGGALIYNNLVYVGLGDRGLKSYDLETGVERATFNGTEHGVWSTPVIDPATNTLYFGSLDQNVYALDATQLTLKWKIPLGGAIGGTPLLDQGMLYIGTFSNELVAVDTRTQRVANRLKTDGWVWATPTMRDGILYFGDLAGNVYALDAATWNVKWKSKDAEYPGAIRGAVAVVDSECEGKPARLVVVGSESKYVRTYFADTGQPCWRNGPTAGKILSDVIVIGDDIIFTTVDDSQVVAAFNIKTHQRSWSIPKPTENDLTKVPQATPVPR